MLLVNAILDDSGKLIRLETDGQEVLFLVTKSDGELTMVESETGVDMTKSYDKLDALLKPKSQQPEGV